MTSSIVSFIDDNDDDSDDDISITSTAPSEVRETYALERILAERTMEEEADDGLFLETKEYLVKWEGYDIDRCTWEPGDNFENNDTLFLWQADQMRQTRQLAEAFDVSAWEERREEITAQKETRHDRRNKKRHRLSLPVSVWPEEEEEGVAAEDEKQPEEEANGLTRPRSSTTRECVEERDPTPRRDPRKSAIYDSGDDSDRPLLTSKRRKLLNPDNAPEKLLFNSKARKGQAVLVKKGKGDGPISSSKIGPLQTREPVKVAPRIPPPTASSFFTQSLQQASAPRRTSAAGVRVSSSAMADRPLMKRTAPVVVRKLPVKQPGAILITFTQAPTKVSTREHKIRNLSHLNNVRKLARNERPPPSVESLTLYDPVTGKVVKPAVVAQLDLPTSLPFSSKASETITTLPERSVPTVDQAVTSLQPDAMVPQGQKSAEWTCWFWAVRKECSKGTACWYKHYQTGNTAPPYNNFKQSVDKNYTCPYWWNGACSKTDEECRFAHGKTRYLAGRSGVADATLLAPDAVRPDALDGRLTCWFWYYHKCFKTDMECAFVHYLTNAVADRYGGSAIPILRSSSRHVRAQSVSESDVIMRSNVGRVRDSPSHSPEFLKGNDSFAIPDHFPSIHEDDVNPFDGATDKFLNRAGIRSGLDVRLVIVPPTSASDDERQDIRVTMTGLDQAAAQWFLAEVGNVPCLTIKHVCSATMVKAYLDTERYPVFATGNILSSRPGDESLALLATNLELHSAGAVLFHSNFNMIIHPVSENEWDFLGAGTTTTEGALRFHIIKPFSTVPPEIVHDRGERQLVNIERLFAYSDSKKVPRMACLFFPVARRSEFDTLTSFLQDQQIDVYDASQPGAWAYFRDHLGSATVLIHPGFTDYYAIPRFAYLAIKHNLPFYELSPNPRSGGAMYGEQRLLPHGRAYLIMDDCFVNHPKQTVEAVRSLTSRAKALPAFCHILGRPGLLHWLTALSRGNDGQVSSQDRSPYSQMITMFTELLDSNPNYIDEFDAPNPSQVSPLYWPPSSQWPGYAEKYKQDNKAAANDLASWFAGWASSRIKQFKRMVILTHCDERTKDAWERKWNHLMVVNPTGWLVEEARAISKKSDSTKR